MARRPWTLPRWFFPWIRAGGWLTLAAGLVVLSTAAIPGAIAGIGWPGTVGWAAVAAVWVAAIGRIRGDPQLRQATVFPLLYVLASAAFAPAMAADGRPPWWVQLGSIIQGPLLVVGLLLWPARRRPAQERLALALDSSILAVAVGLLVWYNWISISQSGVPILETAFAVVIPVFLLVGVNMAVVRRPADRHFFAFKLVVWLAIAVYAGNTGFAIARLPFEISAVIGRVLMPAILLIAIAAGEALRTGWRWPWAVRDGTSPVPWVAVLAIMFFVLNLVFNENATGVGPIVLGALGTMVLLVARQAVTARQNAKLQAERAVLEADARIAALVRHTSDVILITGSDLRIRFASPSAEVLWAAPIEHLMGKGVVGLVDPAQRDGVNQLIAERMLQPGVSDVARWRMPGPGGEMRRVEAVVTSLFHQPSVNGMVFTLRDQTDRALLEEQLNQAQKMEAIGQLAGGVAHDFNNLLTTIMGHSEVGIEVVEPNHPARDDFEQILKASHMAASLTRQLLAFSRKQVVEPKVIEVTVCLAEVVRLLKRLIKEDVTTVLEVAADVGHVKMDPSQLEQVVLNLAVNARDAMPEGGRLMIRARRQLIAATIVDAVIPVSPGDYLVVEVTDTGVGMDQKTQARIFEPFFTTKPVGRGTGLGLASVYGIVRQNEGGLVLTSALGRGTMFAVYLPRVAAEPEAASVVSTRSSRGGNGATILLVEDETPLREIAEKVLLREGYRVLVAKDGDEALMLAAGSPYPIDLVLADVIMPGISGRQMIVEMRKLKPISRVLYMSGYPGDDLIGHLNNDDRLLRKPFTPFVLLENIRAVFEGRDAPTAS